MNNTVVGKNIYGTRCFLPDQASRPEIFTELFELQAATKRYANHSSSKQHTSVGDFFHEKPFTMIVIEASDILNNDPVSGRLSKH